MNLRPLVSQTSALTGLRHAPMPLRFPVASFRPSRKKREVGFARSGRIIGRDRKVAVINPGPDCGHSHQSRSPSRRARSQPVTVCSFNRKQARRRHCWRRRCAVGCGGINPRDVSWQRTQQFRCVHASPADSLELDCRTLEFVPRMRSLWIHIKAIS